MLRQLRKVFGCDSRSLALFRIAIAVLILVDIVDRFPHSEAFYSEQGIFPSELSKLESPFGWSLNYLSGTVVFQQSIFISLAIAALSLAVGFYTRIATLICWILIVSIHVRNPLVLIGGDTLLRLLLFWSLFVPLGKSWSWDAFQRQKKSLKSDTAAPEDTLVSSVGTGCLIIQVFIMYWFAGLSKITEPWLTGTAMEYVLRLEIYVRPVGAWMLQYPEVLKWLTFSTLALELVVPFFLFLPFWNARFRLLAMLIFWSLHIGIELSLDVGLFGIISMMAWFPIIPGVVWDRLGKSQTRVFDQQGAVVQSRRSLSTRVTNAVALFFLLYIIVWNTANIEFKGKSSWTGKLPPSFFPLGYTTMVAQNFQMFGNPPRFNPWFVYYARLRNGEEVDLLRKCPVDYARPDAATRIYASIRWKKLHRFLLRHEGHNVFHQSILEYFIREWNRAHSEKEKVRLARIEVFFEAIGPEYLQGDYIKAKDLAFWESKESVEKSDDELLGEIDSMIRQFESGSLIERH
ncbi:HTTM domain-containing protein [Pirellulaceae bacterium]|nr:HTTM domain-containing protein [Pirellulaceae bacterium]